MAILIVLGSLYLGSSSYKGKFVNSVKKEMKEIATGTMEKDAGDMNKWESVVSDVIYITTEDKRSLYTFTKDTADTSNCIEGCLEKWPAYFSEEMSKKVGFGMIVRTDGSKQLTYKLMPLYTFFKDKKAGDVYGEGIKGVWFLANMDTKEMMSDDKKRLEEK